MSDTTRSRRAVLRSAAMVGVGATLVADFAFANLLFAALFACSEGPGVTIITDSPAQLGQCRLLNDRTVTTHQEQSRPPMWTHEPAIQNHIEPTTPSLKEHGDRSVPISVPLERLGSLFVVPIQINETRVARLILDTGASHTILSRAIARDLGLFSLRPVSSVTMHTVGGTVQTDMVQVDSIRIAGAEVRNSVAAIYDLPDMPPDIEGLLGLSVLRQFEVTLDTTRGRLHLGLPQP